MLAERLRDTEALVLIRERTQIRNAAAGAAAETEADQPAQRLSAYRYRYLHPARHRRVVGPARRYAVLCDRRIHLGPGPGGDARDPAADGGAQGRQMADRRRPYAARQDARHLRLWPDRRRRRRLRQGVRHEGAGLGARAGAGEGARRRLRDRRQQGGISSSNATCFRCTCAWSMPRAASSRRKISRA